MVKKDAPFGEGKWDREIQDALDDFWQENHYPPSGRELMDLTGCTSTSIIKFTLMRIPGVRIADNGKAIPEWVDKLFGRTMRR